MKKIVQLNCVYNFGSTGKIVKGIHDGLLANNYDSYVFYARGKKSNTFHVKKLSAEFIVKIQSLISKITGYVYGGSFYTTCKFIDYIKKIKPDIVHLQCINANTINVYAILSYLKCNNIPTVLTLHAEFMYTGGCVHAYDCAEWDNQCKKCPINSRDLGSFCFKRTNYHYLKLKELYSGFNNLNVVCVSDWLKNRAFKSSMFDYDKLSVVYNGVDISIFKPNDNKTNTIIKSKYNIKKEDYVILHVTPNFKDLNKGKEYFLELSLLYKNENRNIVFIVVGFNDDVSILSDNVIPIKFTKNQLELSALYSIANITLLLSKRETFSMVCAESLCCGTPIVGFKAGAPELISIPEYSCFVDYGEISLLKNSINNMLDFKKNNTDISKKAIVKYSSSSMINRYVKMYNNE